MEQWMINTLAFIGGVSIIISLAIGIGLAVAAAVDHHAAYKISSPPPLPLPPAKTIYLAIGESITLNGYRVIATRTRQEINTTNYDPPESDTDTMTRFFAAREELEREKASADNHG